MKFVDASVFVHAFIKPKRELKPFELEIKNNAKGIVRRIRDGEEVCMTVIQLAEIANLLENNLTLEEAFEVEEFLLFSENIKLYGVSKADCLKAVSVAKQNSIGLSDAIAYVLMLKNGVNEIYSFDRDFDKLGVKRVEMII
ncbi:MAG: type II toxin-antitoxin system VapC family toxin [Nitrososphaeria archaeon]|nr:type II toxin-antitoxin system VapC family toxin [Nitrososphaeria archaeon]